MSKKTDSNIKTKETSLGSEIDLLIRSNLKNWHNKEYLLEKNIDVKIVNRKIFEAFQANKLRNKAVTEINRLVHNGPLFHFRNYHNY